jgi:hypothetical protein
MRPSWMRICFVVIAFFVNACTAKCHVVRKCYVRPEPLPPYCIEQEICDD